MANIFVSCESVLLKRAVERFLGGAVTTIGACDMVISDKPRTFDKPALIIGEHLRKPFTKSQLLLMIERFDKLTQIKDASNELVENNENKESLQEAIAKLTDRFAKELLELIKRR
ncbi:hypothetical protein FACS1894103_7420 [Campylobacterota bacterium]|nr:hypothetical protein FACS1894103_7420 [Campylobacterota bacterium]